MKYRVDLTAMANVSTRVQVEADSAEEAQKLALRKVKEGVVDWEYDGADDNTAEVVYTVEYPENFNGNE